MECATFYALGHGFLQLLRILLAWPAVFLTCALIAAWRFKPAFDGVLAAIAKTIREGRNKIKVGGVTVDLDGRQRVDLKSSTESVEESLTAAPDPAEGADAAVGPVDAEALAKEVTEWRTNAAENALAYLELLLAPKTKALLYYLSQHPIQEFDGFYRLIDGIAVTPEEADAIKRVILDNGFVVFDNGKARGTGTLTNWIVMREARNHPIPPTIWAFVSELKTASLTAGEYANQSGGDGA